MERRQFIASVAAAVAAGCSVRVAESNAPYRVSLAEWSLHRSLRSGRVNHLDFPRIARSVFGLDAVEYVNTFFKDRARDRAYLQDMKTRADDAGVRSLLIMCDGEGRLGDVDESERTHAVENHYKWVEAARFLGCHSIRVNAESQAATPEEKLKLVADGLRRLAEFAEQHDLNVLVENHGGVSSNGAWVVRLMQETAHPRAGTLPDFGNFTDYDRYRGVDEMMPYARAVSAKSHDFDAQGNEIHTDYARMLEIVRAHGYRGYIGIEYEGERLSEFDGIRATRDLLLRLRSTR